MFFIFRCGAIVFDCGRAGLPRVFCRYNRDNRDNASLAELTSISARNRMPQTQVDGLDNDDQLQRARAST
jgi:hypothetical protein